MKLAHATAAEHSGDSTDMHVRASRAERSGGGGGDREQRKASSEYVESGRQDSSVPHRNIQPHENACGRVHAERLCFLGGGVFTQMCVNIHTKMAPLPKGSHYIWTLHIPNKK